MSLSLSQSIATIISLLASCKVRLAELVPLAGDERCAGVILGEDRLLPVASSVSSCALSGGRLVAAF